MILDTLTLFAEKLDVTGSPVDLDLEAIRPGPGQPLKMFIQVDDSVTGMTGFSLQDAQEDELNPGNPDTFEALLTHTANLAGDRIELSLPSDVRRFLRCNLAGTVANGRWTAGIVLDGNQTAV